MTPAGGSKFGPYEIVELLGTGGMGEVYKARDARLNRFVAIKTLRPQGGGDEPRAQRFIQEARAASALNHPNIITIHDISAESGPDYLVMEYVAGKTLSALIRRSGMPFSELLRIAIQVADALTAAHEAGIIHRDLKPSNIMVSDSGVVKVLDFGLAKRTTDGKPNADEETMPLSAMTEEGAVLGTAAYMSPEQAEGKPLDTRTDIFSFGALLYEMATGRRAFQGRSTAAIIAAVINEDPLPVTELAPALPREFERMVMRCLRKDPARRQQHMVDVKVLLEESQEEFASGKLTAALPSKTRPRWAWVTLLLVVLAMASGTVLWFASSREELPPRLAPLTAFAGSETAPSFSPDGNQVAFAWNGDKQDNADVYVKMIGNPTTLRLTTNPAIDAFPAWSPDGGQIAFVRFGKSADFEFGPHAGIAGGGIYLVSPLGGTEQKIADFEAVAGSPAWSPNGKFLVVAGPNRLGKPDHVSNTLYLVPVEGGEVRPYLVTDPGRSNRYPAFDPGGRLLAFSSCTEAGAGCDISVVALDAAYLPRGRPHAVRHVQAGIAGITWAADGRSLIYSAGTSINDYYLWRTGLTGSGERMEMVSTGAAFPAVARKGHRLAFSRLATDQDIWRARVGGPVEPFLVSSALDMAAQFSPDGRRVVFASGRSVDRVSIWISDANGANLVQLTTGPGSYDGSPRWSPDGRWIAFDALAKDGRRNLRVIESGGGQPRVLSNGPGSSKVPSWSRDGRWIYFTSDRTGNWEIWRMPAQGGAAEQISRNGGYVALESSDGKTLYYTKSGSYGAVPLYARALAGGEERKVLDGVAGRGFEVFDDGIYYVRAGTPKMAEIRLYEFATGRSRLISMIQGEPGLGLSVSPDRKTLLFAKWVYAGTDLMLVENFR